MEGLTSTRVTVYTRHSADCADSAKGKEWRRCGCPKWLYVNHEGADRRITAKTRSWQEAERKAQELLRSYDPTYQELMRLKATNRRGDTPLVDVLSEYYAEMLAMKLRPTSIANTKSLFGTIAATGLVRGSLLRWVEQTNRDKPEAERISAVNHLDALTLTRWRTTWTFNDYTSALRWGMVKSFMNWCLVRGLVAANPCAGIKRTSVRKGNRCGSFTEEQYEAIVAACATYSPQNVDGRTRDAMPQRMRALVELMRWGGTAIVDAVQWSPNLVDGGGVLRYRRQKNKELAIVPLPPHVVALLATVPLEEGVTAQQPFRFCNTLLASNTRTWSYRLGHVFARAGIGAITTEVGDVIAPHPHMFRDTFAIWYLERGHDVADVAKMLGHSDSRTTEKNYATWVQSRQAALIDRIRTTQSKLPKQTLTAGRVVNIRAKQKAMGA